MPSFFSFHLSTCMHCRRRRWFSLSLPLSLSIFSMLVLSFSSSRSFLFQLVCTSFQFSTSLKSPRSPVPNNLPIVLPYISLFWIRVSVASRAVCSVVACKWSFKSPQPRCFEINCPCPSVPPHVSPLSWATKTMSTLLVRVSQIDSVIRPDSIVCFISRSVDDRNQPK